MLDWFFIAKCSYNKLREGKTTYSTESFGSFPNISVNCPLSWLLATFLQFKSIRHLKRQQCKRNIQITKQKFFLQILEISHLRNRIRNTASKSIPSKISENKHRYHCRQFQDAVKICQTFPINCHNNYVTKILNLIITCIT